MEHKIITESRCFCGSGLITHLILKCNTGSNGVIGPGFVARYDFSQKFYCTVCGLVYHPTQANKLKSLSRQEMEKLEFKK